jgi:hypothetical protein
MIHSQMKERISYRSTRGESKIRKPESRTILMAGSKDAGFLSCATWMIAFVFMHGVCVAQGKS